MNTITIGIDCRLWKQTGVGRYIRNLVFNLLKIDKENEYVLFVRGEEENEIENEISEFKIENLKLKIVRANISWHSVSEQFRFPGIIKRQKIDLMHFPYIGVPIFYKEPFVVTIHDLIPYHYPTGDASTLPIWLYGFKMLAYRFVINSAARNSRKIIAVSNATKDEIADHLYVDKRKIEMVYEAADDFSAIGGSSSGQDNYFLFVGNVYPHKNADKLIEAFEKIVSENKDLKLVFAGSDDSFYRKFKKKFKKMEEEGNIVFKFNSSDKELSALYKNAICLIRPSLMEGFSLPPLEAMASDCLVCISDIPSHREIIGDLGIYFNPKDKNDIYEKMKYTLAISKNEKEKLINKGKERITKFSWKTAALKTLKIYESCLGL